MELRRAGRPGSATSLVSIPFLILDFSIAEIQHLRIISVMLTGTIGFHLVARHFDHR
jgi:hypothetical protein